MVILDIIWPVFALVVLIFGVLFATVVARFRHMKATPPGRGDFADNASMSRYFAPIAAPSDNLRNLFEMPVLFFALVALLLITRHADYAQVALGWLFVAFRCAHSMVHLATKNVRLRFLAYFASTVVLSAMWIGFFVDMVAAAQAYSAAMSAAGQP
jgi:hypothetical protein